MKKNMKRIMTGVAGATMMLNGCAVAVNDVAVDNAEVKVAEDKALEINGYQLTEVEKETVDYKKIANVAGVFAFDQNVTTPADEVFSIFGTALTGICAKPSFAMSGEETTADYYINVSGSLKRAYQINLTELEEQEETKVMACSCATGPAVVNAEVMGIPVKNILELGELEEGTNTITFRGADGFGLPMPLNYVLENNALIVYRVSGQELADNQRTQVWMPNTVAQYFTRNVVSIELTAEDEVPEVAGAADEYQTKVNIVNNADTATLYAGDEIVFEGYADDCGSAITAVEFSLDGGETWTTYETTGAATDKWVYWYFTYTPEEAGSYKLQVRAITEDGKVSPLGASLYFEVEDKEM